MYIVKVCASTYQYDAPLATPSQAMLDKGWGFELRKIQMHHLYIGLDSRSNPNLLSTQKIKQMMGI